MAPSEAVRHAQPAAEPAAADAAALRAEHDALAARLEVRASIHEVRRASIALFAGFLLMGLGGKLGWDRWGIVKPGEVAPAPQHGPALHVWAAVALACLAFVLSIRWYLGARRLLAEEDALFARFREIRAALGYDA